MTRRAYPTDATRARRWSTDHAKRSWYALHRAERFARRLSHQGTLTATLQ